MLTFYLSLIDTLDDRQKITLLYRNYRQLMYTAAVRILHNASDAEDIVHEAFLRVIRHLAKIEDVDSARTKGYLVTIVKNLSLDLLDKQGREKISFDEETLADTGDDTPLPIDQVQVQMADERLEELIGTLPEHLRETLRLYFYEDCSATETARLLDISPVTVYRRLHAAEAALKNLLQKEGYDAEDF